MIEEIKDINKEFYTGWKKWTPTDAELATYYTDNTCPIDLRENEYLIVIDANDNREVSISKMEDGKHTGKLDAASSGMTAVDSADSNLILNAGVDPKTPHEISAAIKNFSTLNLPTTGGKGTMLLSIGGVVLMAAGAYLIFFRKKEN